MFTGIIEVLGQVERLEREAGNLILYVKSGISDELKVDQSIAHNGVCLTVEGIDNGVHRCTAIQETLLRSNLDTVNKGDQINLERCTKVGDRLDGHIVQGHVDATATLEKVSDVDGSWELRFQLNEPHNGLVVEKGSISINGISLTVADCGEDWVKVSIIPYTWDHTNLGQLGTGASVNIEFDVLGKYVQAQLKTQQQQSA